MTQIQQRDLQQRLQRVSDLEKKLELADGLPFLYGWPWYKWAWDFFKSHNHYNYLCAANQISKSSTQIRKCLDWATDTKKWSLLWRRPPLQFWYLYPAKDVASIEFDKKWVPEFLPRGKYKDHPQYGWTSRTKDKGIHSITFKTGVTVYFKTYAQDPAMLQSGSVDAIFCDEELPEELFDELNFRMAARGGYFHMVFTATLGQEKWRRTIEEHGRHELFKGAFKRQVSMWECLHYIDGSPSPWTKERIRMIESSCSSEAERLRRVEGRFIKSDGLKYQSFERDRHYIPGHHVPKTWQIYSGVDIGSGGDSGHPAALLFLAVNPEFTEGRVIVCWRGDKQLTTAGDILLKYRELRGDMRCTVESYDWASKDFSVIATRSGESFIKAEKNAEIGEYIINSLFKNNALKIYESAEAEKLIGELVTFCGGKNKKGDDLIDALRFAVSAVPWNWSKILKTEKQIPRRKEPTEEDIRRNMFFSDEEMSRIDSEIEEWNEYYGS